MHLDAAVYWRLRYLQAAAEQAVAAAALAESRYHAALVDAGINPAAEYRWADATTSLVPVIAEAPRDDVPR